MIPTDEGGTYRHALVIPEAPEREQMRLMDRYDLDQAMAELQGTVIESFVYIVKGGKKQLSYAGIKEAARLYRNVHFGATATPLPDGSWMITSYAHNLADNVRVDYPMPYPAFDPSDRDQSIDFRATLSKSLRNALAAVLPIAYLNTMIGQWTDQRSGTRPQPPAQRRPIQPVATVKRVETAPRPALDRVAAEMATENGQGQGQAEATLDGTSRPTPTPSARKTAWEALKVACRAVGLDEPSTLRQVNDLATSLGLRRTAELADVTVGWLDDVRRAIPSRRQSQTRTEMDAAMTPGVETLEQVLAGQIAAADVEQLQELARSVIAHHEQRHITDAACEALNDAIEARSAELDLYGAEGQADGEQQTGAQEVEAATAG